MGFPIIEWKLEKYDSITSPQAWQLRVKGRKSPAATVWLNGVWHTWDRNGVGGENDSEETVELAKKEALYKAVRQGFI